MKVRFVIPMVYVDVNLWIVWEHPETKEIGVFKTSMSLTLIHDAPVDKFKEEMIRQFGSDVELEDLGLWNNYDPPIKNPFTGDVYQNG